MIVHFKCFEEIEKKNDTFPKNYYDSQQRGYTKIFSTGLNYRFNDFIGKIESSLK